MRTPPWCGTRADRSSRKTTSRHGFARGHLLPHPPPFGEHPDTWVESKLGATEGPVVAVSDYMRAVPDQIRQWVPRDYTALGGQLTVFSLPD